MSIDNHLHNQATTGEWPPKDNVNPDTALVVNDGVAQPPIINPYMKVVKKRPALLSVEEYLEGIFAANTTILSKAITLVESALPAHRVLAQKIIEGCQKYNSERGFESMRIGITGVPGAGKSTFIEAFGGMVTEKGHKLAVLAIDPSSEKSKGSILGDKTRMETLCNNPKVFIRPSPSAGSLGGVARKTRETIILCEAAGYDVVFIETVGVGQSETTVRSMVDFFMLVVLTGAGDDLQGIKKGIMELADAIVINKADGDNLLKAKVARGEYERMIEYIRPATEGWQTHAYTCSAYTKDGIPELWEVIRAFRNMTENSGVFQKRRKKQLLEWMHSMIDEHLHSLFFEDPVITGRMPEVREAVLQGVISPTQAVKELVNMFDVDRAARRQVDLFHPESETRT